MEGNIAATYSLIYRFLKQQSQHKAAEAVKRAAKAFIVLRNDTEQEGPPLEDIIKEWRSKGSTKSDVDSLSENSDSSDDSSSDLEDGSSDSSSEDTSGSESEDDDKSEAGDSSGGLDHSDGTAPNKLLQKAAERDTSVTLSSAGENALQVARQFAQIPKEKSAKDTNRSTKNEKKGSESDSSDLESSDSSRSLKSSASDSSDSESSSCSSSSCSSSDSSSGNEANAKVIPNKTTKVKSPSTSGSSSTSEAKSSDPKFVQEDTHVAKKRKTLENGAAVTSVVAAGPGQIAGTRQRKENSTPKVKERFQRVKVRDSELLLNNGYEARAGAVNDYGERAHRDLVVTRGAGFRKEKNKKKRGSYRGGEITMESHSIKFDF